MGRAASTGSPGSLQAMVRGPSRSPTPERTTGGKSPAMPTAGAIAGAEAQSARLVIMDPKEARARARTQTLAAEAEIVVATGPTYSSRSKPPQRLPKRLWAPSEATDANDLLSQAFQVRRALRACLISTAEPERFLIPVSLAFRPSDRRSRQNVRGCLHHVLQRGETRSGRVVPTRRRTRTTDAA